MHGFGRSALLDERALDDLGGALGRGPFGLMEPSQGCQIVADGLHSLRKLVERRVGVRQGLQGVQGVLRSAAGYIGKS